MWTSVACVLWLLVITQGTTQAKECRRTNTKPKRWCLETTCQTDKDCGKDEKCRCDGDCGMSCIKNGLKCSSLRTPKNAIVQGKGRAFQDTVTYICKKGYTLRGPRKKTCRGIGTWDGRNTRCPMLCKNPGDIKFGSKNEDKRYHKVGSKVNYWCFPGYEREGSREITCTKSGAWSSSPPKCKLPSCTKPTSPENSQTRKKLKEKYKYNEIILYECKHGYFISGMRAKRCLNGGKWSDMNMKCIAKSCKNPGTPKNGRRKGYVFTFKKKVYYECNRGYILIGPQFRICQSNQKWSDKLPTCEPVDCGRLPIPTGGEKIEETKTTYLGRVVFRCNKKGFELKGSRTRVCQENGKWDGSLTKCERVTCTNPKIPDFGGRKPDMDKYVYEDKIEFSCKTNHTRYGSKTIICQADRTWTEKPPKCLRPCPDPGIPKGGFRLNHSFLHDKTVRFSCKKGWKLDGKEEIKCKNGDWTDIIPRCLEGCSKPHISHYGVIKPIKDFYSNGESISFGCVWGYKPLGDSTAWCTNGKWTSDPPTCKRKCRKPSSLTNGWRLGYEFFEGKEVNFYCNSNYDLIGKKTITCLASGEWDVDMPTCKKYCTYSQPPHSMSLPSHRNGQRVKHGTPITFVCLNGYSLDGRQTVTCNDGKWNPDLPQCKAQCKDPGKIPNGYQMEKRSFKHKGTVKYGCNRGYTLDGQNMITCNDGQWIPKIPYCNKWCNDPGTPDNGYKMRYYGNRFRPGSTVSFRCRGNRQLVGSSKVTCNDGKWSPSMPKCLERCPRPSEPRNGQRVLYRPTPLSGDKVTFLCNLHYDLIGNTEIFCIKGKWNGTAPRCIGRCNVLVDTSNLKINIKIRKGDWIKNGTKIRFSCQKGHQIQGKKKTKCIDGRWTNKFPECNVPCNQPKNFYDGTKYGDGFKQSFTCNYGFSLEGESTIFCKNGAWNKPIPKCYRNCRHRRILPNIIITKHEGLKHGDKLSFDCKKGFRIKGSPEITCKDGEWSDVNPACAGYCPDLGHPRNGAMRDYNFEYGYSVRFSCNIGYSREGPEKVTCINGNWSDKAPSCKKNCMDPGIPRNGQRHGIKLQHLKTVKYFCKDNYTMIGSSEIQCVDGEWSSNRPTCTDCDDALGMQNGKIPDKNIKASLWSQWRDARYARLGGSLAWCTGSLNINPFLEINLGRPFKITSLATQGSPRDNIWETKYIVSHSLAKLSFIDYREDNREKVFDGNVDATTVVKHKLKRPFIAKRIRFYPSGWRFFGLRITKSCMRVEIYGCDLPKDCVMVGSPVLGEWVSLPSGGSAYYKSYVKTIDHVYNEVQLELDDKSMHDDEFKIFRKSSVVMDTPNKRFDLDIGTRVLVPIEGRFYTGKIKHEDPTYYGVNLDDKTFKWAFKKEIRVLGKTKFCDRG